MAIIRIRSRSIILPSDLAKYTVQHGQSIVKGEQLRHIEHYPTPSQHPVHKFNVAPWGTRNPSWWRIFDSGHILAFSP